ncbi:hypothetical protein ABW19_dt0200371 [Dactylella cylindrospora]|nr:hypothetical protein ABW19_dt0200371 [Dactylella cylindrospora]
MVRRSRRRKRNQDPNRPQIPSQKPKASVKPPSTPHTDEDALVNDVPFRTPKQFPAIAVPMSLDDHDFINRMPTSSPEDSGSSEFPVFNMSGMQWAVNQPSSKQKAPLRSFSPPTTATLASSICSRATSLGTVIKEEQEDDDIEVPDSAVESSHTDLVPYRSYKYKIPPFEFSDLQIQTDKPLDINLANLYLRTIFGVTYRALSDEQVVQYNDALIVPMFKDNKSFLHGCLSSTALHLTGTNVSEAQRKGLVTEVYRHRQKSLKSLKEQVAHSDDTSQRIKIAATVCALISFEVFSRRTDWQVHVKAATDCVILLNWCNVQPTHPGQWFIYSRILWLDILSSVTTGIPPVFSRFFHDWLFLPPEVRNRVNRLVVMTGCEDSVLYLISEITCLEHWKFQNPQQLPWHLLHPELVRRAEILDRELRNLTITDLANRSPSSENQILTFDSVHASPQDDDFETSDSDFGDDDVGDLDVGSGSDVSLDEDPPQEITEVVSNIVRRNSSINGLSSHYNKPISVSSPTDTDGGDVFVAESTNSLIEDRETFRKAVTEAFRIMARVYLRIVVYGFDPNDQVQKDLLDEMLAVIDFIPSLYMGYERSIISPLLIVGCLATKPAHRQIISTRLKKTPQMAKYGNLGNVDKILFEVWNTTWVADPRQAVPWRQIMKKNNWEYLMV